MSLLDGCVLTITMESLQRPVKELLKESQLFLLGIITEGIHGSSIKEYPFVFSPCFRSF
jgi:hypothetical protein